ncbi:MAG: DUF3466 family protein [Planctomycetes bacterium]|nr:DUF3466 family protein [Planctomycetota bacterium]
MSNKKNKHLVLTTVCLVICLFAASNSVCAQVPCGGYEVTAIVQVDECPPLGFPPTLPLGLNEQGWMVGSFRACIFGPNIAWLWTPEDGLVLIPMPPDTNDSTAVDICGSQIVGHHFISDDEFGAKAFLYDHSTKAFTDLGTLPGGIRSEANAINSAGEIVGFWGGGEFLSPQAFIWRDGEMIDLNPDFETLKSDAKDINDNGIVTGWMGSAGFFETVAFIWDAGKVTALPPVPGGSTSEGRAINDLRQVVGHGIVEKDAAIVVRAFLWENNVFTDLGTLPGFDRCAAIDINNSSTVIGECDQSDNPNNDQSYVWNKGVMINLNDLIPEGAGLTIREASAINNSGQIAARAVNADNDTVAVLLTPIKGTLGDLNGDCQVSTVDLLLLFSNWGPCDDCGDCPADLDGNCTVSTTDLLILFSNWG